MSDKRHILAIDPGKMTGICLFSIYPGEEPVLVWSNEVTPENYAQPIRYTIANMENLEIVCERFVINAQTGKNSQAPYSLEQIGVLKQIMRDNGLDPETQINWQAPADAMSVFTNPKLKKLGYWHKGGAGHALDSIRHGLLRLMKTGWKPTKLLD